MRKIFLNQEFDKFMIKIKNNENFALMRNADGELAIMEGRAISAQEGNWSSPMHLTSLGESIYESLKINDSKVFYAISCPCCDRRAYYWYMSRIVNKQNITFANIWINANYNNFKIKFPEIKRDAILIANYRAEGHKIGNLNILKHYKISDDCISFWEESAAGMIEQIKKEYGEADNLLYVVSAGPMSGPIIAELFKNNPNNCYVDFGSSIDIYYREGLTRPYMEKNNRYAQRNCWMYDPKTVSFDVTAVCTLYKRPESLVKQINALERQSLLPKQIFLYQDGIAEYYKIQMLETLSSKFANIKIANKNTGVWERFRFAREAQTPYVCIFDDDTIPGSSWLENCHFHMMRRKGIYGTNGIVMTTETDYPFGGHFHVGWNGPVSECTEVDFVGHAWFTKTRYLDYMFEGTERFQNFKYTGEDMCLSVKAKEKGIRTYVPPHPNSDKSLWGSTPIFGDAFGNTAEALSFNMDNLENMQKAVKAFEADGWHPMFVNEPQKVEIAHKHVEKEKTRKRICKFYRKGRNFIKRILLKEQV